jgi:hypothetical protein
MDDFKHLFRALEAGCPPHAGLAIGFDRLIAVMQGRDSVRDVIAFPKNSNGEDLMVQSPSLITQKQLQDYHLKVVPGPQGSAKDKQDGTIAKRTEGEKGMESENPTIAQAPNDESYIGEYMDYLKVLPRTRIELPPSPQSRAAVLVSDSSPLTTVQSDTASIIKPRFKELLTHFERGSLQIQDVKGLLAEEMLVKLGLEKEVPESVKRGKTIWGGEELELVDGGDSKSERVKGENPSDPADLGDAVKPPR